MQYDVFISYNTCDKLIADAVCHYIESRRLRCFIAPRDIKESDWAGSITNAIENARAFVIVVSEHSLASNEVAKEITLATQNSSFIFPFRIDESELKGRMKYHLSAFHWIDAVTPPMEQRLEELADRVAHALQSEEDNYESGAFVDSVNRMKKRLIGKPISPRGEFIGRTKELDQIDELFASGEHAVFLCGMGGIGKSEIAKAFAKRHAAEFTTAVFASYQTDLLHLIASDQAIRVENLKQASAAGGQGESTQDYYDRKMDVLRGLVDEHTLIIIDNFDVEDDEKLADVMDLPCKLIFTSRTDFSSMGMPTVQVGPMDDFEDLFTLFQKIVGKTYTKEEDKQAVRDIIRLLDCHTYAVSLTAAQMKAGFIKPQKMLSQLQEEGLNIKTRSVFSHNTGDAKSTAYQYMQALFDFSRL
ncbi:MAG: toll/interleukin-1 receptor domain-containing protein, partial [Clostridia bacterium]|nr:toll/interleukin-1 receptor domain-containing protein [Clostridia bacterium]